MTLATLVLCVLGSTGTHQRWESANGPIHTWYPGQTVPSTVVLYVHGYNDDADSAFTDHHLAEQFASSGFEALFVVPEAPSNARQPVRWNDLEALLNEVATQLEVPLPLAVLVFGHSGGNRTVKAWLASARVNHVVLLDGFYGDPKPFERWLGNNASAQLILIGEVTFAKAKAWRTGLAATIRERVSHRPAGCSHMEIVTDGKWIPDLLRENRSCRSADELSHQLAQVVEVERLVNDVRRAEPVRAVVGGRPGKPGHQDEGDRPVGATQPAQRLDARQQRHLQIADDQIRRAALQRLEQLFAVAHFADRMVQLGQLPVDQRPEVVVVVCEQDVHP
jgi:pimeloyl-ACP methyl ester carboxylesterase